MRQMQNPKVKSIISQENFVSRIVGGAYGPVEFILRKVEALECIATQGYDQLGFNCLELPIEEP